MYYDLLVCHCIMQGFFFGRGGGGGGGGGWHENGLCAPCHSSTVMFAEGVVLARILCFTVCGSSDRDPRMSAYLGKWSTQS